MMASWRQFPWTAISVCRGGVATLTLFDGRAQCQIEWLVAADGAEHRAATVPTWVQGFELGLIYVWGQFMYNNSITFLSRHHVQQQCKQQLDYRSEGREAAPARGQYPEDQGMKSWTRKTER